MWTVEIRALVAVLLLTSLTLAPRLVRAGCGADPPPTLTMLPADGATNVPLDAQVWVLVERWGQPTDWSLVLGEETIPGKAANGAWAVFELPPLSPLTPVTVTVQAPEESPGDGPVVYGPFTFTTGEAASAPPAPPSVSGGSYRKWGGNSEDSVPGSCSFVANLHDCYDSGTYALVELPVADPQPSTLLRVTGVESYPLLLPGACSVTAVVECNGDPDRPWNGPLCSESTRCLTVRAVNLAGHSSEAVEACIPAAAPPESEAAAGCGTGTRAAPLGGAALLAGLLAIGRRRRPRRAAATLAVLCASGVCTWGAEALACSCTYYIGLAPAGTPATGVPRDAPIALEVVVTPDPLGILAPDGSIVPSHELWRAAPLEPICPKRLVVVQPDAPLEPLTTYRIRSLSPELFPEVVEVPFTTGAGMAKVTAPPPVEAHLYRAWGSDDLASSCGDGPWEDAAVLALEAPAAEEPYVVTVSYEVEAGKEQGTWLLLGPEPAGTRLALPLPWSASSRCFRVQVRHMDGTVAATHDLCQFEKCAVTGDATSADDNVDWGAVAEGACAAGPPVWDPDASEAGSDGSTAAGAVADEQVQGCERGRSAAGGCDHGAPQDAWSIVVLLLALLGPGVGRRRPPCRASGAPAAHLALRPPPSSSIFRRPPAPPAW